MSELVKPRPRGAVATVAQGDAIEKLLFTQQFEFEERENMWRAVKRFRDGKAEFADYLIGEKNLSNGCDRTSTFDRAFLPGPCARPPAWGVTR